MDYQQLFSQLQQAITQLKQGAIQLLEQQPMECGIVIGALGMGALWFLVSISHRRRSEPGQASSFRSGQRVDIETVRERAKRRL